MRRALAATTPAAVTRSAPAGSTQRTRAADLIGGWQAHGQVTASQNDPGEPVGAAFERLRGIASVCSRGGACRL